MSNKCYKIFDKIVPVEALSVAKDVVWPTTLRVEVGGGWYAR